MNNASPIFKWMWKSCARGKHKFFFCLLLSDRLHTTELLKWKNMTLTRLYLYFVLNKFRRKSTACICCLSVHLVNGVGECSIFTEILHSHHKICLLIRQRHQFNCRIFREVIMITRWTISCHRNIIIFDGGIAIP
jgi:hypothetical protein